MAVPGVTPPTPPVAETVATPVALLLHVPPLVASVNAVLVPVQTVADDGSIDATPEITVTALVTTQLPMLYEIVADPAEAPKTAPVEETVAIVVLLLVHVPPETVSPKGVLAFEHTVTVPAGVITVGLLLTVTVAVAGQVPVV